MDSLLESKAFDDELNWDNFGDSIEQEYNNKIIEAQKEENKDIALYKFSKLGILEEVKRLVQNGADIHFSEGLAIKIASIEGHFDIVEYLISIGSTVEEKTESMILAVEEQWVSIVKLLINNGANIRSHNNYILRDSCRHGETSLVRFILEKCQDLKGDELKVPIIEAVYRGHLDIIKLLLDRKAPLDCIETDVFINNVKYNKIEVVKFLLEKGLIIDGDFAILWSALLEYREMTRFLLIKFPNTVFSIRRVKKDKNRDEIYKGCYFYSKNRKWAIGYRGFNREDFGFLNNSEIKYIKINNFHWECNC